jgi:hypothetical protein
MMTKAAAMLALVSMVSAPWSVSLADDVAQTPAPAPAPNPDPPRLAVPLPHLGPNPARPTQAPNLIAAPAAVSEDRAASAADAPKFVTEDKWLIAGYNNDEIIYQVFITNHDTRIIRCNTEIHGFYFDKGKKQTISDRQITTVFPNQPTQAGTWLDMDQQSGATYSVRCHPL